MQPMRRFLPLLLAMLVLVLPLRGFAGALLLEPSCPMEHGMSAHQDMAGAQGCCNDGDEMEKTGKPCKSGQECKVGCQVSVTGEARHGAMPAPHVQRAGALLFPPSFVSHAVWRPPSSV